MCVFFKQKTAYEMRISDWSSDVCSADLRDLKSRLGMSVIWITHDLGVVAGIADTLQVMYAGRILERGPVDDVFADPRNAYTLGLLNSLPQNAKGRQGRLRQSDGAPPRREERRVGKEGGSTGRARGSPR